VRLIGVDFRGVGGAIDLGKQVALLDGVADLDVELLQLTGNLCADIDIWERLQRPERSDGILYVGTRHHRGRVRIRRLGAATPPIPTGGGKGDRQGDRTNSNNAAPSWTRPRTLTRTATRSWRRRPISWRLCTQRVANGSPDLVQHFRKTGRSGNGMFRGCLRELQSNHVPHAAAIAPVGPAGSSAHAAGRVGGTGELPGPQYIENLDDL
jgi:hypothetical protein